MVIRPCSKSFRELITTPIKQSFLDVTSFLVPGFGVFEPRVEASCNVLILHSHKIVCHDLLGKTFGLSSNVHSAGFTCLSFLLFLFDLHFLFFNVVVQLLKIFHILHLNSLR